MIEIYALTDPRDGVVRYIGKARNAQKRLKSHLREARRKTPLYAWLGKLRGLSLEPGLVILRTCADSEWQAVEREEISKARASNPKLLNVADGGDEPHCPKAVRAENGRKVAASRPQYVMRAYRIMDHTIRESRRWFPHRTADFIAKKERFAAIVDYHRRAGTITHLDDAFKAFFADRPKSEAWN